MSPLTVKRIKRIAFYSVIILISLIWFVPIYTLISTALKSKVDFYAGISLFELPDEIAWSNFTNAFIDGNMLLYMKNSLIVTCLKVPLGIFVESMIAFAITRSKIKHKTAWFIFFLIGMMLPMQTALVPINVIFSQLGLLNTYFGLFYVYVGFGISFGVLVLRAFMIGVPKEIDEAACVDGCNKWRIYWQIVLPICKPAVATLVITDFLATWNEYLLASVIINDTDKKTIPAGLMTFVGEHGLDYGYLTAGVLVAIIPVVIVYTILQRYFVEGISGAVKG